MIAKKGVDYDLINRLYMEWINERNPFEQRKKYDEIKRRFRFSKDEFLFYSARDSSSPFNIFKKIFSLADLFETLEEMRARGEDISQFTSGGLLIDSIEDIRTLGEFAKRRISPEIANMSIICVGSNILAYGDVKSIGRKFTNIRINRLSLEQIEQMMKSKKDYKGIPITITIDNIEELPLEKLADIEQLFDVAGVRIAEKDKLMKAHQGEKKPLNVRTYKQIRTVVDNDIIGKLYIAEGLDKIYTDFELATQIIDIIANKIQYDHDAAEKPRSSYESINASGIVGLLTGKSICKGYSEILRNVLSCVNINSSVIDGTTMEGEDHSWNQVELGGVWFNVDLTAARDKILQGQASGNLFMSDMAFFGDRKTYTFEKGKEVNGKKVESTVIIGGHSPHVHGSNHKQCGAYITPYLTTTLIERSRHYEENYKRGGNSPDYKGVVPYVGSNVEKMRSAARAISAAEYQ